MATKLKEKPEVLIFSVYQSDRQDTDNQDNHQTVVNRLSQLDISHKVLNGRYQGIDEKSILVKMDQLDTVQALCKQFNQESYLHLDKDRVASLRFTEGRIEKIGNLEAVSKTKALKSDAYTFDPMSNTYFIVNNIKNN